MPGSSVRAKQRTECSELKPSHVQLSRVFLRRDKPADVGAPVRDATQPGVDRNGNVSVQRLPSAVHVARPEERGVALHARVSVAMQREWPLIRTELLRALPIHAIARQA